MHPFVNEAIIDLLVLTIVGTFVDAVALQGQRGQASV
jgi:hypothetical protein